MSEEEKLAKDFEEKSKLGASYDRWTLIDDATLDYGGLSKISKDEMDVSHKPTFYITTAINYTNGPAHMGHAYEAATADVIARFQRWTHPGAVYFVTGSDEHGQKIAGTAADQGKAPIDICNKYVTGFQVLNQRILISNDDYVRTTSQRHKNTARELWRRCEQNGDVYLDRYSGWYNVKEETFVTETEAKNNDYKDPETGIPYKQVEEESYFFKMSKYKDALIKYIEEDNPSFIQPNSHKNLILQRLKGDELRDLSISRTTFDWGIPVPGHDEHVMYVWMDALSNYLTGVNGLQVNDQNDSGDIPAVSNLHEFWPANVHIIGKDILWFHTVIWPCLLMSANVPLPRCVFAHGFVNDKDGRKMSKSIGNVVDPHDMLDKFDVDTFRWYLCKEAPYGGELSFNEESMRDMHNSDLCKTLGNLVHRATSLCGLYCQGTVPDVDCPASVVPIANLKEVIESYTSKMNSFDLQGGASLAMQAFRDINGYLQEQAPWDIKDDLRTQQVIVRASLEAIYVLSHLLLPFLPHGCAKIFGKLHTEPVDVDKLDLSAAGQNLAVGTVIEVGDILYQRLDDEKDKKAQKLQKKESYAEAQRRKKEAKAKQIAAQQAANDQPEFTKIDIRVGQIVKVWNHESADKLYCEQIDLGEEEGPREIASGLREHYSLEDMQDRKVLVICNLKAAKIVGFSSNGMVLAAKSDDGRKVELVEPPADAKIGERVMIDGLEGDPVSSTQVKKKKVWEKVVKNLRTTAGGVATWDGKEIKTSTGACKAATLEGAPIS